MRLVLLFCVFVAAALAPMGCQSPPPPAPGSTDPSAFELPPGNAPLSAEWVEPGRQLYLNKCARCHKFYDPRSYPEAEWRTWMHKMSRKSKLHPDQEALLTRYLDRFRSAEPSLSPP